ncbi:type 4 pilus major pilin [Pectobacterium versatile]|uniref:type 4 pilus major pilin n=1 Tax=Pectobacterium versatile TaxID=2488639 RepID=UPI001F305377|nr:type 4 pilus major pilin [Pectobacterium versatile]
MKINNVNHKIQQGFSLLELLLVLGTIAALIVGAFIVYPKAQAAQRAEIESKKIATIQAGIKSLYAASATYTGLTNSAANKAGLFPANMIKIAGAATNIVNTWKGYVTLAPAASGPSGTAGSAFTITYTGVPAAECTKIISAVAGNVYLAQVGTTTVKDVESNLDIEATTEACSIGGNSNTLVLISS